MGSIKRKRRKKLVKAWKEFQVKHELSDAEVKFAKSAGYPLERLLGKLASEELRELPIRQAISLIHSQHEQVQSQRRAEIAAGIRKPKAKKKKGSKKHDPEWAKAKKLCRLNQDDIRKAKELGFKPKSLIKNIPSSKQQWKASVKDWISELYEKRFAGKAALASPASRLGESSYVERLSESFGYTTAFDAYLAGDFAALHAFECDRERVASEVWMKEPGHESTDEVPF